MPGGDVKASLFMKDKFFICLVLLGLSIHSMDAQHISEFSSLGQGVPTTDFKLTATHTFQYLIESGDALTEGDTLPDKCDFTGYVPLNNSSKMGYLSVNSESAPGAVSILDIELDDTLGKWVVQSSEAVAFDFGLPFGGTAANCSGTVTPWHTIISCEEYTTKEIQNKYSLTDSSLKVDEDLNGYDGYGWAIEIDPVTKQVIDQPGGRDGSDKLWAMGNFKHENAVVHHNTRTVYQGADDTSGEGFLFKFVADEKENLSSGDLYVYKGNKQGVGSWLLLKNKTPAEQNSTLTQCLDLQATSFGGIEDVEINPIDGMIYFAVKREDIGGSVKKGMVYRFKDADPLTGSGVQNFEIYAGGNDSYNGIAWGNGTDNLVFDDLGNLWVAQDESVKDGNGRNYIWVIENGHSRQNPKVNIFAQAPLGSEPTGLTFSPDYKYLFMSVQHPDPDNKTSNQPDAFGNPKTFDKDVVLVIARKENLNNDLSLEKDIMITQYYHDEASNSKWIEVKNRSNKLIREGSYFLERYQDLSAVNPLAYVAIPEMAAGEVILFKNPSASKPDPGNLGPARQIETMVCDFGGDDIILISSTMGAGAYTNRRDMLGENPQQNWGLDKSLIRGRSLEDPEKDFQINNWIEISSENEVNTADVNTNIALGTHDIGSSQWNGSSWNKNTIPDRTRNVELTNTFNASGYNIEAFDLKLKVDLDGEEQRFHRVPCVQSPRELNTRGQLSELNDAVYLQSDLDLLNQWLSTMEERWWGN